MKNFLIVILSFVPLIIQAQTDSLYCKNVLNKLNEFRAQNSLQLFKLSDAQNKIADIILKNKDHLKDISGNYFEDSIRIILINNRFNDLQFKIIEKKINDKNIELDSALKEQLKEPDFKRVGIASNKNTVLTILFKGYIGIIHIDTEQTAQKK